ncbi:hypothetical protein RJT34_05461 [Clitoria ternatea]|uniref:PLATZ transcription factor family protein n=1 Tax=Clitoria ternatea TaxID=43366 RepID=A0AAN9K4H8_CLITE
MYNEVLRLDDAQTLLNCSLVQPYTTNKAKVIYLKQRPPSRSLRGSGDLCITCGRSLQESYIFCSLSCKVHHLLLISKRESIKGTSSKCDEFCVVQDQEIEDSQVTIDSVLDSPTTSTSLCTMSGSTSSTSGTAESLKKKRGSVHLVPGVWYTPPTELATAMNRRKRVPHRSPLY